MKEDDSTSIPNRLKLITMDVIKARPVLRSVNKVLTSSACRSGEWHGPVTDHFDGKRFYNYYEDERAMAPARSYTRWWITRKQERVPVLRKNSHRPRLKHRLDAGEWECTLINHATHLIRFRDMNILTDPVWSDRPSPFQFLGPKRRKPPGMTIEQLPQIHLIVISHDHYDHLDLRTLKELYNRFKPVIVVPIGNKSLLECNGMTDRVIELDWWEHVKVKNTDVCLTPARHYSARYREASERNKTLWGGFFLTHNTKVSVYFCGDTAWTKHFADIRERLGSPDLALLSTGAYKPRHLMRYVHMSPSEAVKAHKILGASKTLAFHFGTWRLTDENEATMRRDLKRAMEREDITESHFVAPDNGKTSRGHRRHPSKP